MACGSESKGWIAPIGGDSQQAICAIVANMKDAFFGYASEPQELVDSIKAGINKFRRWGTGTTIHPWSELDGPSVPIVPRILKSIGDREASFFDISVCNQNVFYEIGYAVGFGKPVFLIINDAFKEAVKRQVDLGLFDTPSVKEISKWK